MSLLVLREGWVALLLAAVVAGVGWRLGGAAGALPGAVALAFVLWFFRDPERRAPDDPEALVAPADGRVVAVEPEAVLPDGSRGRRISVFLSVFDVHVNRSPAAGEIREVTHSPGAFFDARRAEAATQNERQVWRMDSPRGSFFVIQIAGLIARRIVAWRRVGDRVAAGERFGMIRFGSRTDLLLPPGTELLARVGDRVRAGETVVARWSAAEGPVR